MIYKQNSGKYSTYSALAFAYWIASSTSGAYWGREAAWSTRDGLVVASVGLNFFIATKIRQKVIHCLTVVIASTETVSWLQQCAVKEKEVNKKGTRKKRIEAFEITVWHTYDDRQIHYRSSHIVQYNNAMLPSKSPVSATTTVWLFNWSRAEDIFCCLEAGSSDIMKIVLPPNNKYR